MNEPLTQANRRILVIDDNRAIHADFRKILCPVNGNDHGLDTIEAEIFGRSATAAAPAGFLMDSAFQGQEGFGLVQQSLAARQPYAVIFMDLRMPPGWDGIETTARIWEIAPEVQIVICTAYSDYSWEEMIHRLGISDRWVILKKPFDNLEVVQLAHALTEKWRLRQEAQLKLEQMEAMVAARTRELRAANEQLKVEMAERERVEEALRQSQKMESLGLVAGGIDHDLNNLLTIIRGCVDGRLEDERQPAETLAALREIDLATDRAAKLTSQILTFSRKKRMLPQELELNQVIQRFANLLQRLLGENIALRIACPGTPLPVRADPGMLEQVLLNLAMNARDAMPAGGQLTLDAQEMEIPEAYVRDHPQARSGRFARVRVNDTGSGIPPAALPHLFDPFFTTKEPGKGTGLGLSTVFGILQQHHGWIEVESQPGHGATFSFFIPLDHGKPSTEGETRRKVEIPQGTETILLVEDDQVVHRLVRNFLQRQGYRIYAGCNGKEGLALWQEHAREIKLVLTDMVMPGEPSGRELAQAIHAQDPAVKIIYTTGYSPDALKMEEPLEEGVNFISKPYSPDRLARIIRLRLDEKPEKPAESS